MPEHQIDWKTVAIVTTTYYPKWYSGPLRSIKHTDKVRGDLALEFLQVAVKKGCQVICVDGKSSKSFKKTLSSIEGITAINRKIPVQGENKRRGIKEAVKIPNVRAIVVSEPEKVSLITECLEQIVKPILSTHVDIVVPKREERRFKQHYPSYMYQSEVEGNNIYNQALRTNGILKPSFPDLDFFFGPRAFKNDKLVVSLFLRRYRFVDKSPLSNLYDPDRYSNALFFPIINALKRNLLVKSVDVPFVYPRLQKENEEIERDMFSLKRNMQRVSILIDLMHFLSLLGQKKTSRLRSIK